MSESHAEHEMRIAGMGDDAVRAKAEAALNRLDPAAALRVDPATGIAHVTSSRQALEIKDALARAGLEVGAATG